ncbi:hypothetical protein LG293_09885 [Citricoccus nitrophenolicus]
MTDGNPLTEAYKAKNREARGTGAPIVCTSCGGRLGWIPNTAVRQDAEHDVPTHIYACASCDFYWSPEGLPVLTAHGWTVLA